MSATPSMDRRKHVRHPMSTTVQFFHGPSQREFPGRCCDISAGGMLMYVPATTPVQPGQPIRLHVVAAPRPEVGVQTDDPIDATIVRVDRHKLLSKGHLAIGVQFAQGH